MDKTALNTQAARLDQTVFNARAAGVFQAPMQGETLCGKYELTRPLEAKAGGEADLYICRFKNRDYVAKVSQADCG